ncbi:MAG: lamin tail domain-containing protein, partial [Akkermansiaceae bacterium]
PSGASLIGHEPHTGNLPPQTIQTSLYTSGQMTYYFEKEFTFNGTTADALIRLTHKIDDGAVFYLNGVELGRYHMPSGTITPTTPASGAIELTEVVATFPASSLVQGSNRLSVEVHQATSNSSDMVFGLQAEILAETAPAIPGLPYQESGEEWIELHNKGNSTINLGGWKLDDAVDFEFDANTSIAPGGYLVIAKNPTAFTAKYPSATVVGPWSGTLSNSGERIQLEDQNGNLADEVTYYDGGRWSSFADGGGCSLELTDPRSDNGLPEQWEPSATNAGWNTYTYQAVAVDNGFGKNNFNEFLLGMLDAGEVLLDDVSVIEDPDGSPIELIVNGDFSGDAIGSNPSGWRMAGNHGLHGKSVVVSDGGNKVLRLISTGASREFHNHIQTDFASNRQIVAGRTYRISYRAKWLRGDNQVNTRFFTDWLSNTKRLAVDQNAGTPGQANSVAVANAGPSISNLTHSPVIPSANQAVTVRCLIEDPDGISNALVRFRKNNSSGFSSVSMVHQGGGIYQGTIPGSSGGSVCQFYIDASDAHSGSAASATFPKEGPDSRAMFQWQDGQANTSTLHNLRIIMHPSDRQLMETDINRMSNYRFPATLIVDETEVYYNIGARLKGSAAGRFGSSATGMNLGFDNMQLYNGVHKSISIERGGIDIQHFAKHLMCSSGKGMSGMFDDPIRLVFPSDVLGNAGRTGIALVSAARYSSAWRKSQFKNGNDGTVYNFELLYNPLQKSGSWKKNNPYDHARGVYEFRDLPLGKETYRWGFQIRSNLHRDNYEPLINTSKAMGLGGSASVSELEKYIDVNQWARTWAYMGLVGNDDTYTRIFDHNFRMYSRPSDDRLVALPWDLDRAFRIGTNSNLIGNDNLGAYLNQPTVRRLFMQHVHDLCTSTFTSAYAAPWAAHFASKTGLNYNAERNYVINRSNYALSQLPANVNFAIQTNSGANFSVNASTTLLEGDGWINVAEIEINGTPAEVNWVDDDTWQLDVPLAVGANPITLTARDLNGVQVGSDSITITNTSITDLASSANLVLTELMYHPADPTVAEQTAGYTSDDDFEFIELMNISSNEIDLSGCAFTDGITFTVPSGTLLPAGARLVIASNPAAFASRYDDVGKQVIGGYTGKLSNSGETLTFISANTSTIFTVTYSDAGDWPEDADGDGYSLVNLLPVSGTDLDSPQNWSPSRELGGGSGLPDLYTYDSWLADFPQLAAASMTAESDDFDQDGYNNLLEFALHSDPTDSASTPAMPSAISNIDPGTGTADYFTFSITRPIATPGVSYTPETSMTLNNDWDNNAMTNYAVLYSRTRNGDVETLTYRSKNPASAESRHFFRMKVEKETP